MNGYVIVVERDEADGYSTWSYARRPAALLAARRLLADPWAGTRTLAALLGLVLLAAAVAGFRASMAAQMVIEDVLLRNGTVPADIVLDESAVAADRAFYFQAMDLLNLALVVATVVAAGGLTVALGESVVSRRRTFAALVATGVPRRTLVGVLAWQSLTPLLPGIGLALGVGQPGVLVQLRAVPRAGTVRDGRARAGHRLGSHRSRCCRDRVAGPRRRTTVPTSQRRARRAARNVTIVCCGYYRSAAQDPLSRTNASWSSANQTPSHTSEAAVPLLEGTNVIGELIDLGSAMIQLAAACIGLASAVLLCRQIRSTNRRMNDEDELVTDSRSEQSGSDDH